MEELESRRPTDVNGQWHVTRGIPIPLMLTIASFSIGQIVALLYWGATISTKQQIFEDFMKATAPQAAQIAVINEKVTTLQGIVNRMDDWLRHNIPTKNQSP